MKRSFADYILYFASDRTVFSSFAKLVQSDSAFPVTEQDEQIIYNYLIESNLYREYTGIITELYKRYQCYCK